VRDVIGREVMLEKQWMGQQVDRSICSWFWKQLHSGVRKKELLLLCFSLSLSLNIFGKTPRRVLELISAFHLLAQCSSVSAASLRDLKWVLD